VTPPEEARARFFRSQQELHKWLDKNHDRAAELWVGMYRKSSGKKGITYREALDEALCFGWIDGVRKRIDDESYKQRFTPRKPRSYWSAVNMKRFDELVAAGAMQPSGLEAFRRRHESSGRYSYERATVELDPAYEKKFRRNKEAWRFFDSQAPSYKRAAVWWIMSAKREDTRLRRLDTLIADSGEERRIRPLSPPPKR